jgi:hypothetical protein
MEGHWLHSSRHVFHWFAGALDTNTERTAAYAEDIAIISKLDTFKNSDTRKDRTKTHTVTTMSWTSFDEWCDKIANGTIRKTAVNSAVVTRPMMSAISIVSWYDQR